MKARFVGSAAWSNRRTQEDGRSRGRGVGRDLPGILFLLSGLIVGLFLSGQFATAGLTYASLVMSGGFGFWLCGLSTLPRRNRDIPRR
ncbi:hypothetical protein TSA1_09630 [Bradyrhizobium nitroreducens]|uniref:Uncharacterized protein n=1 Tax=Bradyrhizobium nitroreducens TaxID=709803 RepID=A0A2M6U8W1_9BRAD|nr:hypothetical protein TSA1_09630 [Bradyrhizobium nitroreducens]